MPVFAGVEKATISNGTAVSGAVHLHSQRLFGILMPATWTPAVLTFQGSVDGQNYFNVYDDSGNEVTMQAAASRLILITSPLLYLGLQRLIVRSGTNAVPVIQGADRDLYLVPQA